jgi:cytochrome c oxidase cbb3-type subunit 4
MRGEAMTIVALIGAVTTVLSVLAFAGVVWWAYGGRRRARFEHAAQAPFALPDELVVAADATRAGDRT